MHLYPCSTVRQIWQGLPNLGCNNQSMTSWKRTTGIWKTPKNKLRDSTATLYSSKGTQPGKVSSLWSRLSCLAICPTLINLFVDQAKNYLARVWGVEHAPGTAPKTSLDEVTLFQRKKKVSAGCRKLWGGWVLRTRTLEGSWWSSKRCTSVVLMQIHIYKRVGKFFFFLLGVLVIGVTVAGTSEAESPSWYCLSPNSSPSVSLRCSITSFLITVFCNAPVLAHLRKFRWDGCLTLQIFKAL